MPRPKKQTDSKFANAIRKRRREVEKSQADVAAACEAAGHKVSAATVSNWESGEQEPNATCLRALANLLKCDMVALLEGEIKPVVEGAESNDAGDIHAMKLLPAPDDRSEEMERMRNVIETLSVENDKLKKALYKLRGTWRSTESFVQTFSMELEDEFKKVL